MKFTIGLFICLSSIYSLHSKCGGRGIKVFPESKFIKQNPIFMIESYYKSQDIIKSLNTKYKIYLKNGNQIINLNVEELCIGQFECTQAILKPVSELESGVEYTMCIDSLPDEEILNRYNKTIDKFDNITYTIIEGKDTIKPLINSIPKAFKKTIQHRPCGYEKFVYLKNTVKDSSLILARVTLTNTKSNSSVTYYIIPEDNTFRIGHNMCVGPFLFESGIQYVAALTFFDASGNSVEWTGKPIKFTQPN